jgi:hypothetical protein
MGTTLTHCHVEVTHRLCGAETFTPRDPDIIELTAPAPYSTSNPTRGGQESCVVNGSQGRPYQALFRRQWDLEKATERQRLEPVILQVSLTATARVRCKKQEDNIPWSTPKSLAHQWFKTTPQRPLEVIL